MRSLNWDDLWGARIPEPFSETRGKDAKGLPWETTTRVNVSVEVLLVADALLLLGFQVRLVSAYDSLCG